MDGQSLSLQGLSPPSPREAARAPDLHREGGGNLWMIPVYVALHVLPFVALGTGASDADWVVMAALLVGRGLCVSGGYPRLLAHGSYRTSRTVQFLLAAGG